MGHGPVDLVEGLLQVAGNGHHVADVDQVELLAQVHPELEVVGAEQVRGPADALRTEASPRAVGRPGVQRCPEDRHLRVGDVVHILDERTLHERPPLAGEMRDLAASEGGQGPVGYRVGRLQPMA
ncbi:MAG TPA: hypothetical protein VE476_16965, partial [Propionibacteriaceae bacterium]|nr:hypothetical protein [Propionibacteriaceae bacterium]